VLAAPALAAGLHKTDAASDWLLLKRHYLGKKGLPGVQVQKIIGLHKLSASFYQLGASEKFKNQPRPLLRPRSVSFRKIF
jgi:hypothetical protein